jgi:hypothetical protein
MQIGIVIFINVILWALFYLVISLKLERSASEFREKRLRREIDGIIREFNETAERNISILENRIAVMKRLMAHPGAHKGVDINVSGDHPSSEPLFPDMAEALSQGEKRKGSAAHEYRRNAGIPDHSLSVKDYFGLFFKEVRNRFGDLLERAQARLTEGAGSEAATGERRPEAALRDLAGKGETLLKREFKDLHALATEGVRDETKTGLSEAEILERFKSADDKYGLIADLHRQGYTIDMLSRCSGISHGEISLVLNLNKPS